MSIRIYINTFRKFCTNVMLNYYHTQRYFFHTLKTITFSQNILYVNWSITSKISYFFHRRHVRHRCRGAALHRDAHRDAIFVEDRNLVLINHPGGDHPAFCLPVLLMHGALGAGSENVHHGHRQYEQRNADHEKNGLRKLRNADDNHHRSTNHAKDQQHGAICPSLIFRFRLVAPARDAHTCRVCEDQLVVEGGHWCDGYGLVIRDTFLVNNCVCVRQVSASGKPNIQNIYPNLLGERGLSTEIT